MARDAVREEWLKVTSVRKRQRRFYGLAIAASVVFAVTVALNLTGAPDVAPTQVATIDASAGSIYVLGEESRLQATGNLASIAAGQTIVTDGNSVLGLVWNNGGSLRLGADTRVVFASASAIELVSGKIYFDSKDGASELSIATPLGTVQHIGTQFIASVDADALSVSVRDGEVAVDGIYFKDIAEERQRLTLQGSSRAEVLDIRVYGPEWEWIEVAAPKPSFDGKTLIEFLDWVAAETGFAIEFKTTAIEDVARGETISNDFLAEPRVALRQHLYINDLDFEFDFEQGVILIVEREGS